MLNKWIVALLIVLAPVIILAQTQPNDQTQTQIINQGQLSTGSQQTTQGQNQGQPLNQPAVQQQQTQQSGSFIYNTNYHERKYNASIAIILYSSSISSKTVYPKGAYFWVYDNKIGGLYFGFKDDQRITNAQYNSYTGGYIYPLIKDYLSVYAGASYVICSVFPNNYVTKESTYNTKKSAALDIGINLYYKWIGIILGTEFPKSYYHKNSNFYFGITLRGY